MVEKIQNIIRGYSINNLRVGKIISKEDTTYVVRIGTAEVTCEFSGTAYVGQIVTLEAPDGDLNKAYILEAAPVGIGEGETVAI